MQSLILDTRTFVRTDHERPQAVVFIWKPSRSFNSEMGSAETH